MPQNRQDGPRGRIAQQPLIRLLGWLRPYGWQAAGAYLALFMATGVGLATPLLFRGIIDTAVGEDQDTLAWLPAVDSDYGRLTAAAGVLLGLAVARAVLSYWQRYGTLWVGRNVATDLRQDLFNHVMHLEAGYHDRASVGRLMTRVTNDTEQVRQFAGTAVADAVNIILLLAGSVAILLSVDVPLALIALLPVPLLLVATVQFARYMRPRFTRLQQATSSLTATLQESLTQVQVVKAFAAEGRTQDAYRTKNETVFERRIELAKAFSAIMPSMGVVLAAGTVGVLLFGGRWVIDGSLSIGTLVAFNAYVGLLAMPVRRLGFLLNLASRAAASCQRIFEILDRQPAMVDGTGRLETPRGAVTFADVTFRYRQDGPPAVADVNFEVAPGETVAIVGPSGSGKTTLVQLVPRLFDPSAGTVMLDGADVATLDRTDLRRHVGFVGQDPFLFSATVADNITFARPDASPEQVAQAAALAGAADFIGALEDGYDTLVGERGVTLSGGQRQRIALARVLLADPAVLVLDDAISAVDAGTETQIRDALATSTAGRTVLIVAQRLSTVLSADRIVVMDGGRVVETGTHANLVAAGGVYEQLFHRVFAQQAVPDQPAMEIQVRDPHPALSGGAGCDR